MMLSDSLVLAESIQNMDQTFDRDRVGSDLTDLSPIATLLNDPEFYNKPINDLWHSISNKGIEALIYFLINFVEKRPESIGRLLSFVEASLKSQHGQTGGSNGSLSFIQAYNLFSSLIFQNYNHSLLLGFYLCRPASNAISVQLQTVWFVVSSLVYKLKTRLPKLSSILISIENDRRNIQSADVQMNGFSSKLANGVSDNNANIVLNIEKISLKSDFIRKIDEMSYLGAANQILSCYRLYLNKLSFLGKVDKESQIIIDISKFPPSLDPKVIDYIFTLIAITFPDLRDLIIESTLNTFQSSNLAHNTNSHVILALFDNNDNLDPILELLRHKENVDYFYFETQCMEIQFITLRRLLETSFEVNYIIKGYLKNTKDLVQSRVVNHIIENSVFDLEKGKAQIRSLKQASSPNDSNLIIRLLSPRALGNELISIRLEILRDVFFNEKDFHSDFYLGHIELLKLLISNAKSYSVELFVPLFEILLNRLKKFIDTDQIDITNYFNQEIIPGLISLRSLNESCCLESILLLVKNLELFDMIYDGPQLQRVTDSRGPVSTFLPDPQSPFCHFLNLIGQLKDNSFCLNLIRRWDALWSSDSHLSWKWKKKTILYYAKSNIVSRSLARQFLQSTLLNNSFETVFHDQNYSTSSLISFYQDAFKSGLLSGCPFGLELSLYTYYVALSNNKLDNVPALFSQKIGSLLCETYSLGKEPSTLIKEKQYIDSILINMLEPIMAISTSPSLFKYYHIPSIGNTTHWDTKPSYEMILAQTTLLPELSLNSAIHQFIITIVTSYLANQKSTSTQDSFPSLPLVHSCLRLMALLLGYIDTKTEGGLAPYKLPIYFFPYTYSPFNYTAQENFNLRCSSLKSLKVDDYTAKIINEVLIKSSLLPYLKNFNFL